MNQKISLIALDLDGTLYNSQSKISSHNKEVLKEAIRRGITVIISTGRPYIGLPVADMEEIGIRYAITANGAAVYQVPEKKLLFEDCLDSRQSAALLQKLYRLRLHLDAFINGDAYRQDSTVPLIEQLDIPESLRSYIRDTRISVANLSEYIQSNNLSVAKMTLNFAPDGNGEFPDRDAAEEILKNEPDIDYVSGGFHNLELTKKGISKSKGLAMLCQKLSIPLEETMACGDSENDLDIVKAAGIGVAMGNAQKILLDAADFISKTNEEDGVAYAIEQLVLTTA